MSGKNKMIKDPDAGCFFCDPRELPGEYHPAKIIDMKAAIAYSEKILKEEKRNVTYEEMQRFVIR